MQLRRTTALLQFGRRGLHAPVGNGGNEDRSVRRQRREDRVGHLFGGLDIDALDPSRRWQCNRSRHQGDLRSCARCSLCNRKALPARGSVGDQPYGIDWLVCRACSDEDVLAGQGHFKSADN